MLTLSNRKQLFIGIGLVVLMMLTRSHHFASFAHLPDASWAVFFLAGVYLRPLWVLPALLLGAWLIDFAAFHWGGVSDFCLTPAYVLLLPAYSVLWFAGRNYAKQYRYAWFTLVPLCISVLFGVVLCELFASGGFYLFSGYFGELSLAEFAARELRYFPPYLQSAGFYIGIVALVHGLLGFATGRTNTRDMTVG